MPPRPSTDSIRNPATSVPIRVEARSSWEPGVTGPLSPDEPSGGKCGKRSINTGRTDRHLPSLPGLGVQEDRHRAVVRELEAHARAEDPGLDRDAELAESRAQGLVE